MKKVLIFSLIFSSIFLIYSFGIHRSTSISICGTVVDESDQALIGASIVEKGTRNAVITNVDGNFEIFVSSTPTTLVVSYAGFENKEINYVGNEDKLVVKMTEGVALEEVVVTGYGKRIKRKRNKNATARPPAVESEMFYDVDMEMDGISIGEKNSLSYSETKNREENNYSDIVENQFKNPNKDPLSTLSIDVDRASYSNVRRFLNNGQYPPANSVRIEEMINYFDYNYTYERQRDGRPFQTFTELAQCPWNVNHKLLKIVLQAQNRQRDEKAANNLVFLIDVSGSMSYSNKLPLLKSAFKLLVDQLNENDKVSIVVYAGAAGIVLKPTNNKEEILDALNKLEAGGSTAGGAGIQLAYKTAKEHFIKDGNNRVILATDGEFNVGTRGDEALVKLIEKQRDQDIFLSILGFGVGNYMEGKMQKISSAGNGNHNYIDNMREAKKVLMDEFSGTLYTIAKDVKIQLEFNPNAIEGYRMIGYENRVLAAEDFNNDKKDAGEMGAGHTVTVLYEIIPAGAQSDYNVSIDPLKYQVNEQKNKRRGNSSEIATIKYRYKNPTEDSSIKSEEVISNNEVKDISPSTLWASYVAEFGLLLRDSSFKGEANYNDLITKITSYVKEYPDSYKEEMLDLVVLAKSLQRS